MSDYLVSLIRTFVPAGVGTALAWVIVTLGIDLPPDVSQTATTGIGAGVTVLAVGAYYAGARWLEGHWPWLGRLLLGSSKAPTYNASSSRPARNQPLP